MIKDIAIFKLDIPLNGKSVPLEFVPFNLEDYHKIITAKVSGGLSEILIEILNKCFSYEDKSKPFNIFDPGIDKSIGEFLLLNLWSVSITQRREILYYTECPICKDENIKLPYKIDVGSNYINTILPYEDEFLEFAITKETKLLLSRPKLFEDDDIIQMIVNNIQGLLVGPTKIMRSEINEAEMDHLLSLMGIDEINNIVKLFNTNKTITISTQKEVECPTCKNKDDENFIIPLVGIGPVIDHLVDDLIGMGDVEYE